MLSSRARRAFPLYICCLTTFTSVSAFADNTLFTAMDDPATAKKPFEGNVQAGYNAQSGNSQSSTLLQQRRGVQPVGGG
jgi:putative salt-induced outer membrane protein